MTSFLQPLMKAMGALMAFFYALVPNYTVDIVLLTILVMGLLTPLTIKGTRSMIEAQKLAPEIKKLQNEYKNDRQALSEATMALYKEHNVSPMGGCLPLLIQLPFFFAIDYMLRGLSHTTLSSLSGSGASLITNGTVHATGAPKYVPTGSALYKALVHSTGHLHSWGLDLDKALRQVGGSFGTKAPYFVLILLSIGSQYYAQRQINRRNPQAAAANPQMQTVTRIMPLMYGVFSIAFPAGLVIYFVTSGAVRIFQQWAMYRFDPKLAAHVQESRKHIEAEVGRRKREGSTRTPGKPGTRGGSGPKPAGSRAGGNRPAPGRSGSQKAAPAKEPARKPAAGKAETGRRAANGAERGRERAPAPKPTAAGTAARPRRPERAQAQPPQPAKPAPSPRRAQPEPTAGDGRRKPTAQATDAAPGNGDGAPAPRPGRQQPKKSRKGR